jgi:prepilin-type N-terminal cleavage/methylation domain-containing protein
MNKITHRHGHRSGFTLVELLVVIAIIAILAGITLALVKWASNKTATSETSVRLQRIRTHLEEYANENNGVYPVGQDGTSGILYNVLSGDFTGQGNPPTGPTYYRELTDRKNPSLVGIFRQNRVILDGFGQTFRYRAAKDGNGNPVPNMRNDGDYDLWSIGPDGLPAEINTPGNLNTEDTQDDIWK